MESERSPPYLSECHRPHCCPQLLTNTWLKTHGPNREIKLSVLKARVQIWGRNLINKNKSSPFASLCHPFTSYACMCKSWVSLTFSFFRYTLWYNRMAKSSASGARLPVFNSRICHWLTKWPWASDLASPGLTFFQYEDRMITESLSLRAAESIKWVKKYKMPVTQHGMWCTVCSY